jgi:phage tail protein X
VVETAPQAAGRRVLDRPEDAREVRSCLVAASPGPPVRSADVGVGAPRSGGRRVVRVGSGAVVRPSAGRRPVAVRRDAVRRAAAATLVGAVSLLVVVLGLLADAAGSGNARSTVPAGTAVVRTQPGDTAWVLARREVPGADAAAVVERIVADNGLAGPDGGVLPGGLTVRVPR